MAHDVFISHSTDDKLVADALCSGLENAGIRCWVAPRDIPPGEEWATAIVDALEKTQVMLLVFSESANGSNHVRRELTVATDNEVVVVPLKTDDTPLEGLMAYYLSDTHWLDAMSPPTEAQIASVVERVHSIVTSGGGGTRDAAGIRGKKKGGRRTVWFTAAAVALALTAVGIAAYFATRSAPTDTVASPEDTEGFATIEEGVLTIGSDTTYPPFETIVLEQVVGFDVDLMEAIGRHMDHDVAFRIAYADEIVDDLRAGEYDMVASAVTITDVRSEDLAFSDPYYNSNQGLLVRADSPVGSLDDLGAGDSIAVQTLTMSERLAEERLEGSGVTILRLPDVREAAEAVASGEAAAALMDLAVALYIVGDPLEDLDLDPAAELSVAEEVRTGEQLGFVFRREDEALRDAVNEALDEVYADGTYSAIHRQWMGVDPYSTP